MKSALSATLVLIGSLGAASAAMAATPVVHHVRHMAATQNAPARAAPVKVMSETPNANPSLTDVFQASDGALWTQVTHDPRSHGLPNY